MNTYKYYIIKTVNNKKEVYGVIKETKQRITTMVVFSNINKLNKGKKVVLIRDNISKNLSQFDFTLTFIQ
jgi:hypothetical protein